MCGACMYLHMYVYTIICIFLRADKITYVGAGHLMASIHTSIHTYMHTDIYRYIHTYRHTYIHTNIHTNIHSFCIYIHMKGYQLTSPRST